MSLDQEKLISFQASARLCSQHHQGQAGGKHELASRSYDHRRAGQHYDAYSLEAIEKLATFDRGFLHRLFSPPGGGAAMVQASVEAELALTGHALSDIACIGGQWQLNPKDGSGGTGGSAGVANSSDGLAAPLSLETWVLTLQVEPYTLLTLDECKDQANRSKAMVSSKCAAAFSKDTGRGMARQS